MHFLRATMVSLDHHLNQCYIILVNCKDLGQLCILLIVCDLQKTNDQLIEIQVGFERGVD